MNTKCVDLDMLLRVTLDHKRLALLPLIILSISAVAFSQPQPPIRELKS